MRPDALRTPPARTATRLPAPYILLTLIHTRPLLQRGGQTIYFGPLGPSSTRLVSYFEAIKGVTPFKAGWVLLAQYLAAAAAAVGF